MDNISLLKTHTGIATKTWKADGTIKGYNAGMWFEHKGVPITDISGFRKFLDKYQQNPKCLVVRGKFVGADAAHTRRLSQGGGDVATFTDQPLHLFCIDIDKYEPMFADPVTNPQGAIDEFIGMVFNDEFKDAAYVWQLSSSAGSEKNKGVLKAHVWFWSEVAYTSAQMKAWAVQFPDVDNSLFSPVQPHYIAAPIFEEGILDPAPVRIGFKAGGNVALDMKVVVAVDVVVDGDDDLSMLAAAQPLDITDEEVDATLVAYPAEGLDYDAWCKCGMALYHQFIGSHDGFVRWVAWSKLDGSRFDDGEMHSKWKSFGGSANPVTMASIIYHVKEAGGIVSAAASWLEQIDTCDDKHALEKLVQFKISADRSIGPVDLAGLEVAVKTKFSEFGVVLRADPLRKLFKPKHKRALPDIGGNELPLETIDNLRAVADNCGVTVRYNVIKKEDEILIPDAGWSIDNAKTASITWLQSECHKVEMRTSNIKNFVTLLADSNQFNPVTEWVNSKPWDGISRLDSFYDTVQEDTDKCSARMKRIVMMRWAVSAIAAAFSPNGVMARGVLVFQGVQYSGKTRWIDALAPKDMELIKTGRALNVHDKDSVKQIVSAWISELGELDATFKKSDIAALKAFITSDTDELRRPYAAAESRYARRTVFAASVNESNFLQDDTGNSRFWVIPIVSINHAHELDMQQVWAEFYMMWKGGEKHYLTDNEMGILNGHNESFTAHEPISEMISSHLDWANFDPNNCKWMQASDVLRWIGKENPTKFETNLGGRAILKLNGGRQRKSHGKKVSAIPNDKIAIDVLDFDKFGHNSSSGGYDTIPF